MSDVGKARATSEKLLAIHLPQRWLHVQAVAARAESIVSHLAPEDTDALVSAAWLHDVGYSPSIARTDLHALDGARYLRRTGFPERVVNLVAFHSCGLIEARLRGLEEELTGEFRDEESIVRDRLWYADWTTGPNGELFTFDERWSEIRARYGSDHIVTKFVDEVEPLARCIVERTLNQLTDN